MWIIWKLNKPSTRGLSSLRSSDSGALVNIIEQRVQIAFGEERVSVKHRVCWVTLFRGRLTRLTRFRVCVNHGATLVFKTTFGEDRGAKAAADDGSKTVGIMALTLCERGYVRRD